MKKLLLMLLVPLLATQFVTIENYERDTIILEQRLESIESIIHNLNEAPVEVPDDIIVTFEVFNRLDGLVDEHTYLLTVYQEPITITVEVNQELDGISYIENSWEIVRVDYCADICETEFATGSPEYYTYEEMLIEILSFLELLQELEILYN